MVKLNYIYSIMFILLVSGFSFADTHYVSLNGTNDTAGKYTNWAGAATQIQWAVNVAISGDTVLVSNGTYNLTNQIVITNSINLKSFSGSYTNTVINGNYPNTTNRCIYVNSNETVIDGFTITNGFVTADGAQSGGGGVKIKYKGNIRNCLVQFNASSNSYGDSGGGGIYLYQGGTVSNCSVISNQALVTANAARGGGLYAYNGGLIDGCCVEGNSAPGGGGVMFYSTGGLIINSTLRFNFAATAEGGGIQAWGGKVIGCVVYGNTATVQGGGIHLISDAQIKDCIISNNVAGYSGGCSFNYWSGIASNCIITANSATNSGGGGGVRGNGANGFYAFVNCVISANKSIDAGAGISCSYGGYLKNCLIYGNTNLSTGGGGVYVNNISSNKGYGAGAILNCTIVNNQAGTLGGGIYEMGCINYTENCIVYGNVTTNDTYDEIYNDTAANTNNYWHTCTPTNLVAGQGNITNNPQFIDQASRNYRLSNGSPCVNAGANQDWMSSATDLDGRRRIDRFSGRVDMGAYEFIYAGCMFTIH